MFEKFEKHKVKNSHKIKGEFSYGLLDDSGYVPRNRYRKYSASTAKLEGNQGQVIKSDFS